MNNATTHQASPLHPRIEDVDGDFPSAAQTAVVEAPVAAETDEQRFTRIATKRWHNAIRFIRLLQNCANPGYSYTEEQVTRLVTTLREEVTELERVLMREKKEDDNLPSL